VLAISSNKAINELFALKQENLFRIFCVICLVAILIIAPIAVLRANSGVTQVRQTSFGTFAEAIFPAVSSLYMELAQFHIIIAPHDEDFIKAEASHGIRLGYDFNANAMTLRLSRPFALNLDTIESPELRLFVPEGAIYQITVFVAQTVVGGDCPNGAVTIDGGYFQNLRIVAPRANIENARISGDFSVNTRDYLILDNVDYNLASINTDPGRLIRD